MTWRDLQAWRERIGVSQGRAAELIGVSVATYKALERGTHWGSNKPYPIDRRTMLACAAVESGVEVDWLQHIEQARLLNSDVGTR